MIQKFCDNCPHRTITREGGGDKWYYWFVCAINWEQDDFECRLGDFDEQPFYFPTYYYPPDPDSDAGDMDLQGDDLHINHDFVPPENCPYLLEHLLLESMENEDEN